MRVIHPLGSLLSGPFAQATLANFLFFFGLNAFVLLPLYVHQLGGTEAEIGLIQAMYSGAGIICQPLIGQWVDRVGRRTFMLLGAGLVVVASAGFALTSSIGFFGVLRAIQGIGFSAFFVANYLHVVDLVPADRRGWALGIFGVSGLLATALAPLAGEPVLRYLGFPVLFAGVTLCVATSIVVLARMHGIRPPTVGGSPRPSLRRLGFRELLRMHMVLACFFGLGSGVIFTFLPTFSELLGVRGLGLFYTAYATAAIVVRVVGGGLIDTMGRRAVIVPSMGVQVLAGCILAAVAFLVPAHARIPVLPFLFLVGLLAGGAHGFLYPALSALLVDVTAERRRASAVGIFSSVFLVGNALGAMLFGYIAHGVGYPVMWALLTGVLAIGFAVSFRLSATVKVVRARPVRRLSAPAGASGTPAPEGSG
jgi:MFS family permease